MPLKKILPQNGKYDFDKSNVFARLPENKEWAKKNLYMVDCQNLAFTKDYFYNLYFNLISIS